MGRRQVWADECCAAAIGPCDPHLPCITAGCISNGLHDEVAARRCWVAVAVEGVGVAEDCMGQIDLCSWFAGFDDDRLPFEHGGHDPDGEAYGRALDRGPGDRRQNRLPRPCGKRAGHIVFLNRASDVRGDGHHDDDVHRGRDAGGSSSLGHHPRLDPVDCGDANLQRLRRGVDAGAFFEERAGAMLGVSVERRSACLFG